MATSALARPAAAQAETDSAVSVSFSAFVDTYFAYDFNRPRALDRAFTTQAARHNEFSVNLAHIAAALSGPMVRARLALQAGTSVEVNYAGEPRVGSTSGGTLSRHVQEATVGVQVAPRLWTAGSSGRTWGASRSSRART